MLLNFKELLVKKDHQLQLRREQISITPGLAHIWVGDDAQTGIFVRVKQRKAQSLGCDFFAHRFETGSTRQILAVIKGLNKRADIHGIILQLPLPKSFDTEELIKNIAPEKDVDGLGKNSPYFAPTPAGIIDLLKENKIDPSKKKTVIIGAGRLVGQPLCGYFKKQNWPFELITQKAEEKIAEIKSHDLLISATGVAGLITPAMVHEKMIVVDGSGVDVDVSVIEPLVAAITPKKGAVGPLTVCHLFENLFSAVETAIRQ